MSRTVRPAVAAGLAGAVVVIAFVSIAGHGSVARAQPQRQSYAEANQLHAAIANGDVEALRYWLTVRHADPAGVSEQELAVTPLARCLDLAARVLDGQAGDLSSGTTPGGSSTTRAPTTTRVGLRVLQDMVALLDQHGARLADTDRQRFSPPVLRWYDDAVARSGQPASAPPAQTTTTPTAPTTTSPAAPPAPPAKPVDAPKSTSSKPGPVSISADRRKSCNGGGHRVYLLNRTQLTITATVTMVGDAAADSSSGSSTDTYSVEPGGLWELGCDVSARGGTVRFILNSWR